jgi:predicted glycosyltransferase
MSGHKSGGRVFFYVQHLLGIGHTMRAALLTRAMRRAGLDVTYVSGGFDAIEPDLAGADVVRLPPVRAGDLGFKSLVGADGAPIDDAWRAQRRAALFDAFHAAAPDVVLIEMFPFGRWPFRFELLPLLEAAQGRARVVCSLRDILVAKSEPSRLAAIVDTVERYFDLVLVHGDPDFIALDETFAPARKIAHKLRYTGYVAPDAPDAPAPLSRADNAEVIVSAGGGGTGGALMRAALDARPLSALADKPWRLLVGPNLPDADRASLAPQPGVTIEPVRPDFRDLLASARLSISQAGYNTVMDLLTCGTRALYVPFSSHGQTEQALRAHRLADNGWAEVVAEETLTAATLAAAIGRALNLPPPAATAVDRDGAARSAALLAGLVPAATRRAAAPHIPL